MLKYFFLIVFGFSVVLLRPNRESASERAAHFYIPPSEIKYFTFGERMVIADSFWLRVIQDFDFCDGHLDALNGKKVCREGWVYHMVDLITDLDHQFYMPYIMGATILSVIVNDRYGAAKVFAKGLLYFPKEWSLAYRAGYHAMEEEKDPVKAAHYFEMAAQNGAPFWLHSLASKNVHQGRPT